MKKVKSILISGIVFTVLLMWSQLSIGHITESVSHSGGTDKCGCHTSKKTGEYHCHKRKQRGGSCPASVNAVDEKAVKVKDNERE